MWLPLVASIAMASAAMAMTMIVDVMAMATMSLMMERTPMVTTVLLNAMAAFRRHEVNHEGCGVCRHGDDEEESNGGDGEQNVEKSQQDDRAGGEGG